MKKWLKRIGLTIVVLLLVLIGYVAVFEFPKLELISGFSAKSLASGHFIDNRSVEQVAAEDNDIDLVRLANLTLNESSKTAVADVFGFKRRTALYRPGLGAMLIDDTFDQKAPYLAPKRVQPELTAPYPYGNGEAEPVKFENIDYERLQKAVDWAFDKPGEKQQRSRAVLVLYKDKLIAEKYAPGFDKNSKILGWSMTKSITATYYGILEKQGKLKISDPAPVAAWKQDERKAITLADLLHMNSGLEWEENYSEISDATRMLFQSRDMTRVQAEKPLTGKINSSFNYSSGTSNLLSGIIRQQFNSHQEYLDYWYSALIDRIGMYSMLVETDMSGNYVGSSYGWATARDWAKFGLLYLRKGNWNGDRLFDESWYNFVRTPTNGSNGKYGGHFWLNAGGRYPAAPSDLFSCNGYQGQMVTIIPSKDLVIVRMGLTEEGVFDFNYLFGEISKAIK
ncbi:serine hydrolase domain-containing protein [Flavobacterium aurantiibacter]|uniref:Serine hydrolase n=1 Tax=Flavobacterium aurantiibacter TaxID=2023067 RepID=A0A255ZXE9_9FLAO|nr:serine hydrolase [Flavobacterium aurantiibacter]OYQ46116.1 serine hydrolase [Flavobacterium aurantiibacter]